MKILMTYRHDKDKACLLPLSVELEKLGYEPVFLNPDHGVDHDAGFALVSYLVPAESLRRQNWKGKLIYVEHGTGPLKGYGWRAHYDLYDYILMPGPLWIDRWKETNPEWGEKAEVGGFTKSDELLKLKIDREIMSKELGLDFSKPIILFAPTWGGNIKPYWGIHNLTHFSHFPNLFCIPHEADYPLISKYAPIAKHPTEKSNINKYLALADLLITDVSSVGNEFALLQKPVIHLELPEYPDCPNGFYIPSLDKEWKLGPRVKPSEVAATIPSLLDNPDMYKEDRDFWLSKCIDTKEGKANKIMANLIHGFITK